jgi:Rrf2 family protein
MLYSKTCEHAIRALTYLATRPVGELCLVDEIAESENVPRPFTAKILGDLVKAGILTSTRGRLGGYAMARDPESVSLLEIMSIVDGPDRIERCAVGLDPCDDHVPCALHDEFRPLREAIRAYLETTTLAVMAEALQRKRALLEGRA